MNPAPSLDRYTYRIHLHGPDDALGWLLDELSCHAGFISAVLENPNDPPTEPMVVQVVLAEPASWKWSEIASANCLLLVGLERSDAH